MFFLWALPPAVAGLAKKNVILISLEMLTLDEFGVYGSTAGLTPGLDAFAKRAVVYTNARSPASWTLPAGMAVFTGEYPSRNKIVNEKMKSPAGEMTPARLGAGTVLLSESFKENGYRTGAFIGGPALSAVYDFRRGFDVFNGSEMRKLKDSLAAAGSWIEQGGSDVPFFVYVQGFDLMLRFFRDGDLTKSRGDGKDDVAVSRKVYGERLAAADKAFVDFLAFLGKKGLLENTVIAFISLHGECLGGCYTHGTDLNERLVHMPLVVYAPGVAAARVGTLVSLLDTGPTLQSAAGFKRRDKNSGQVQGMALYPFGGKKGKCRNVFSETDFLYSVQKRAVYDCSGWKYVYDTRTAGKELYNLNSDPGGLKNVYDSEPQSAARLEGELLDWLSE